LREELGEKRKEHLIKIILLRTETESWEYSSEEEVLNDEPPKKKQVIAVL
jgi:hypothetical protein